MKEIWGDDVETSNCGILCDTCNELFWKEMFNG